MSLPQERINDIIINSAKDTTDGFRLPEDNGELCAAFNLALSRIREEQKPALMMNYVHNTEGYNQDGQSNGFDIPLFTIPPAAPDCKELVEALEMVVEYFKPHGTGRVFYLGYPSDKRKNEFLYEALAKHKASMGEKE